MSIFSEHLNQIIQDGNFTLPYLEQESGFSLALISKIKTGKRLPDSEEKMLRLIRALRCTIEQEEVLLKDYRIEKMGREKYLCMEESRKVLESLSNIPTDLGMSKDISYKIDKQQVIAGTTNINMMVQYILDTESARKDGKIYMIAQPEFTFLKNYLLSGISNQKKTGFHIEHIIALYNTAKTPYDRRNMQAAALCLQLSSFYPHTYDVYYHHKTDFISDFFPFCIISSDNALMISSDYQNALFLQKRETLTLLLEMFQSLKVKCRPFFKISQSIIEFLQMHEIHLSIRTQKHSYVDELSFVPCVLPMIPGEIAFKRMNKALAEIPYITEFLTDYFNSKTSCITSIFPLKGVDLFMDSGISYELPPDAHEPFSPRERVIILKRMLHMCDTKELIPIVLKENSIQLSQEFSINIYNANETVFVWNIPNTPFSSCVLQDSESKQNIREFIYYLRDSREYTYTAEESLKILKEYTAKYLK